MAYNSAIWAAEPGSQSQLLCWLDFTERTELSTTVYCSTFWAAALLLVWFLVRWFWRWLWHPPTAIGQNLELQQSCAERKRVSRTAPQLLHQDNSRTKRLLSKTTVLQQPYIPCPWLGHRFDGHMQSVMFAAWSPPGEFRALGQLVSRHELVVSSFDKGTFRLDWFGLKGLTLSPDAPVVFVVPGVVGKGTNAYVKHLATHLMVKHGWRVVAKNWRGIGSRLTTPRPETWDDVALSDARDAIRHVRNSVGAGIPIMAVGFSFGGCMMTALAGSVPPEEHGLCGLVSISGLFNMPKMMKHVKDTYPRSYTTANTKVTLMNYRKSKVYETLTSGETDLAAGSTATSPHEQRACQDKRSGVRAGDLGSQGEDRACVAKYFAKSDDDLETLPTDDSSSDSEYDATIHAAGELASKVDVGCQRHSAAPTLSVSNGTRESTKSTVFGDTAAEAARASLASPCGITAGSADNVQMQLISPSGAESKATGKMAPLNNRSPSCGLPGASSLVRTSKAGMANIKNAFDFHEAFTLPSTGDANVDAYFSRVESTMNQNLATVDVPSLALVARDDPLCPPEVWKEAAERASKSPGVVVAITDYGGHCGFFEGIGGASWLDRVAGDFLASTLELWRENNGLRDQPPSPVKVPSS